MVKLLLLLALLFFLFKYWNRLRSTSSRTPEKGRPSRFDTSKIEEAEFREVDSKKPEGP